jgi:hypothetical protein
MAARGTAAADGFRARRRRPGISRFSVTAEPRRDGVLAKCMLAEDLVQNRIFADLQKSATQHTANPAKI